MKWIFVESYYDMMEDIAWDEYISEDGKFSKYAYDDGYEEIYEICD